MSFNYDTKDTAANPMVVICTENKAGKSINWQGMPLKDLSFSDSLPKKIFYSLRLSDFNLKDKNTILKIFIWNKNKDIFDIDNINIWTDEGNRYIYSLYFDFK